MSQKFPSAGGGSVLVSMQTSRLSFQTNAVKPPQVPHLISPIFNLICFGPKSRGMTFLLGRTVPHEFILHLSKSSESLGEEKKLSTNILCLKPSNLLVKCQTAASVAVMSSLAECESLPKYTLMPYVYTDSSHNLQILMPKVYFSLECIARR